MTTATQHNVTITEQESIAVEDGGLVYRARCSCGWIGWAVFDRDNARRQRDRHLSGARVEDDAPAGMPS